MLAQLAGKISQGRTLMFSPLEDRTWESRVRDCILSLTPDQRMVVAHYLTLRCDLGDRSAQHA